MFNLALLRLRAWMLVAGFCRALGCMPAAWAALERVEQGAVEYQRRLLRRRMVH